ncbi:MAG: hypothetical protein ACRD4R_11410 [Candidatus Acidiferrales bacterium]
MGHGLPSSAFIRALATMAALMALGLPAMAQSKRPPESAQQKACTETGKQYFDSLHLKGGSLFGTHYDTLSEECEAEYVVIAGGVTQLSIDNATKRENLAMYRASEKTGKVTKCYVLSTRCQTEGVFLNLSAKVFRWITF